jgi:hypothetical protein
VESRPQCLRRVFRQEQFVWLEDGCQHHLAESECLRIKRFLLVDELNELPIQRYQLVGNEQALLRVIESQNYKW